MRSPRNPRETGAALVSVIAVSIILLLMVGALVQFQVTNARHERSVDTDLAADYVAAAGLNDSFQEIASMVDVDNDGLGAIGVAEPRRLLGLGGAVLGEYRVVSMGPDNTSLRAIGAVPNFADPVSIRVVEAGIVAELGFDLAMRPGAIVVSGGLDAVDLQHFGDAPLLIDGQNSAAIAVTETSSYDLLVDELGDRIDSGDLDPDALQGDITSEVDGMELPIIEGELPFMTAEEINAYRHELRDAALALEASADRVISSSVTGDAVWGTADAPEVTFIDATNLNNQDIFDTPDQTITGVGTLVIHGDVRATENLNLDWTGDIIVVGDQGGGDDVVQLHGTQGSITGNFMVLASDTGEGSIYLDESDGTVRRPTDLQIEGSFIGMSDAEDRRIEMRIDGNSQLGVDGVLGLFGDEVWLEVHDDAAGLDVEGTFLAGIPIEADSPSDKSRFRFRPDGPTSLVYDEDQVAAALTDLGQLEQTLGINGDDETFYDRFRLRGVVMNRLPGESALSELENRIQSGADLGIDLDAIAAPPGN